MHLGVWCIVFLWPLLSLEDTSRIQYVINRNWLSTLGILVVFYINYFILVDHYFFKHKKVSFYLFNLVLISVIFFLVNYLSEFTLFNPEFNGIKMREVKSITVSSIQLLLPMTLGIGMCVGIKMNKRLTTNEFILQKIKQTQLDAEIKYLRYQVQPHFLFNTLNNIYSLIDSSPTIAKSSIHNLSKMMRYLLHETVQNTVPIGKEVDFLERYIDLMQLRVSTNLSLKKSFPIINQPIQIAPLLLISFIENAYKHGIDTEQESHIIINLTIKDDLIIYHVENSYFPQNEQLTQSGIGLENLRKRLELIYPDDFKLSNKIENTIYKATLELRFDHD